MSPSLTLQLTESEIVSENCRFRCEEQGIEYFRFNPKLTKVYIMHFVPLYSDCQMLSYYSACFVCLFVCNALIDRVELNASD